MGFIATAVEVMLAICLIFGFKSEFFARLSEFLLLIFALSMTFSLGIKGAFEFSVFTAAKAAFTLNLMKVKFLEVDILLTKK